MIKKTKLSSAGTFWKKLQELKILELRKNNFFRKVHQNMHFSSAGLFNRKEVQAQGTIEYMVIVAIVIVIALVTIGILLQLMGQGAGIGQTSSQIAWLSAQPFSITDWKMDSNGTDGNLILILQNNTSETLDLVRVSVGSGTDWNAGKKVIPAGVKTTETEVIIKNIPGITAGSAYAFPKASIYIDYNKPTLSNMRQAGVADITGTAN